MPFLGLAFVGAAVVYTGISLNNPVVSFCGGLVFGQGVGLYVVDRWLL